MAKLDKQAKTKSHKQKNIKINNSQTRLNRIFVLDTNVLLHDTNAVFTFRGVVIGIPFVVLEELDTFKKERNELGMNAREVIRILDNLRSKGNLSEGVEIGKETNSILKVLPTPHEPAPQFCSDIIDNLVIQTVQDLKKQGFEVTFVTKDINARIKSDSLGIDAEDYTKETISIDEFYKGWTKILLPNIELKKATEKQLPDLLKDHSLLVNEFVVLQSQHNEWNNRVFRFLGGKQFKEIFSHKILGDFQARNVQQIMALDLLLDDSIKMISLLGPAGTGKTFLVLLTGLHKVLKERLYRKFLISRPIVALGADVGYLPGDLQEKLLHWMQPVHDNLELIFSQLEEHQIGQTSKDRRHKKRHPKSQDHISEIDKLKQKGILSLEAITYMRGRSIPNQFVFIDEVQNLTPHEVKTIVSRAGEGTKVIIAGDPFQIDSPYLDFISNGLTVTSEKFKDQSISGTVFLETSERSELAKLAAEIL